MEILEELGARTGRERKPRRLVVELQAVLGEKSR
jgi:hypothetical protein